MKYILSILLLITTPAAALAIMPLGDSITKGFHGSPAGSYRYELFNTRSDIDFVGSNTTNGGLAFDSHHQGVAGHKIEEMTQDYGGSIATNQPDIVLILAGTNNHNDGPAADYLQLYADLVGLVFTNAPNARIVISTVPKFGYDRLPPLAVWTDEWVDIRNDQTFPAMNAAIAGVASDPRITMVDLYSALDPAIDLHADAVHPLLSGQQLLAGLFQQGIERTLSDLTLDGEVTEADLGILLNHFGQVGDYTQGDIDGDGMIGVNDLDIVLANWTDTTPPSVPEPTVALVLLPVLLRKKQSPKLNPPGHPSLYDFENNCLSRQFSAPIADARHPRASLGCLHR